MKSDKLFKFKFSKEVDIDDSDGFSHPFYTELANCLDEGEDKLLFFYKDSECDDFFANLQEYKIKNLANVLAKYGYEFQILDVTDDVIMGKINIKEELFHNFRLENTTIDQVLDKINESGLDSLDEIDRKILGT
jgi:hypothetical protein